MPRSSILAMAIIAGLFSCNSFAQDATSNATRKDTAREARTLDDTIIVTGKRLHGEVSAIEEKRQATANVSIMSKEEIEKRPGGNLSDVLSHMPGLVGYNDMGKGQAATGQREYVSIRGMDSNYASFLVNGVRVPAADPGSRALSLNFIAPYGLDSVIVTRTPTADMVGDGIGGMVDIHTPTAFSLGKHYNKVTVAGSYGALANKLGFPAGGGTVQGEVARIFGDHGQFGFYGTAFYDRSSSAAQAIEAGGYRPTQKSESTVTNWRALTGGLSLDQMKYDMYNTRTTRYGGNFAFGYHDGGQELYLRATYGKYTDTGNDSQRSIRNDGDRYFNSTVFSPERILPGGYFQTRDKNGELFTLQVGGITDNRDDNGAGFIHNYDLSLGRARIGYPNYVEGSLYAAPVSGNAQFDTSNPAKPRPVFSTPAVGAYVMDPNTDKLWKFQGHDGRTTNRIVNLKYDLAWHSGGGVLDSLKGGVDLSSSRRDQYDHLYTGNGGDNFAILAPGGFMPKDYTDGQGGPLGSLPGRNVTFMDGLFPGTYRFLHRSTFVNGMLPFAYQDHFGKDPKTGLMVGNPGAYTHDDFNRQTVRGREDISAAYLQGKFVSGAFTALLGLRYERTRFNAEHWVLSTPASKSPTGQAISGGFVKESNSYNQLLPNVTLLYRGGDRWVARASVRRSFSRPAFSLVAGPETRSFDPVNNVTTYNRSNPNLRPATSTNFDASIEFYPAPGAVLEAGIYQRNIKNFIYSASTTGGNPSVAGEKIVAASSIINQPMNGGKGTLRGLELNGRYQWASGFGLGGNMTLQRSEADSLRPDHYGRKTWLPRAPERMYNVDVFYDNAGFHAQLAYQYTGLQLLSLTGNNMDAYMQPIRTLDFDTSYRYQGFQVALQVKNLLNKPQFYKTLGPSTRYLGTQDGGGNGSYVETGRVFRLVTSYTF